MPLRQQAAAGRVPGGLIERNGFNLPCRPGAITRGARERQLTRGSLAFGADVRQLEPWRAPTRTSLTGM